jgi:thiamine-monophosphate kinase
MKLSGLGERKIIEHLSQELDIGDDAAWFPFGKNTFLVFSADMIYEKTHRLPGMTFQQFGKLAVTVNLSDVAAMGAQPLGFLLSYGGPDVELKKFQEIIRGIKKQCEKFKVKFAGGDTNESPGGEGMTLAGSILGFIKGGVHPLRSGAKVGDLVGVTGTLGAGFAIDLLLQRGKVPLRYKNILDKALEPEPRVKEGLFLRKYVHSLTDISDSLAVSLHCLARESGVGIKINLDNLPLLKSSSGMLPDALYRGGDYELVFTFPNEGYEHFSKQKN